MTEMEKLIKALTKANVPFEIELDVWGNDHVFYPNIEDVRCSIICNKYSYGGKEGLLEIMGLVYDEEDSVEGYLTAEIVAMRILHDYLFNFETEETK